MTETDEPWGEPDVCDKVTVVDVKQDVKQRLNVECNAIPITNVQAWYEQHALRDGNC